MLLKQFYTRKLGHASYLIGSSETGTGVVVDPRRDVEEYLRAAREEHLAITYVVETHVHNDYVSGGHELAARAGAHIVTGTGAGVRYDHRELRDDEELRLGSVVLRALKTPGHTPEHVSYVVIDESRASSPWLLLSGGALLVGSIGRPDLLGPEMQQQLIRAAYQSLHDRILSLPDYVEVYPTHVAGSLCGARISSRLSTTVGYERRFNRYLQLPSPEAFAAEVLEGLPAVPRSWRRIRETNLRGAQLLGCGVEPVPLKPAEVQSRLAAGHVALDTRPPQAFGGAHIPGAFNVWLQDDFPSWVGWVVPPDQPLILVLDRSEEFYDAARALSWIGYDQIAGYLDGGMWSWQTLGLPLQRIAQVSAAELHDMLGDPQHPMVLDVRHDPEWRAGHIPGAVHIQAGELPQRADQLDRDRPIAVHCATGFRSSVAASILKRQGFPRVFNVLGGFKAWERAGYEVTRDDGQPAWD